jgi:hypothetical protein
MWGRHREEGETIERVADIGEIVKDTEDRTLQRILETSLVGERYSPIPANSSQTKRKKERKERSDKTAGSRWSVPSASIDSQIC